jgi:predicted alpha/beta hydrolase
MRPVAHADELHFARTPDGWRLALHRYRPQRPDPGTPVILCSGYACNRWFIDYDERYSLARFLARLGFDAWVLELRGRGLSYPATRTPQTWQWTFDELATIDVPAAIAHVTSATGHPVRWVGHSMGGRRSGCRGRRHDRVSRDLSTGRHDAHAPARHAAARPAAR